MIELPVEETGIGLKMNSSEIEPLWKGLFGALNCMKEEVKVNAEAFVA
jgi:hypothetical protein